MGNILVVGSLCLDYYYLGENDSPLPFPGGKGGNQAVVAKRLGAEVTLAAIVGKDPAGEFLLQNLEKDNIPTTMVLKKEASSTGHCEIQLAAQGQNVIRGFPGANLLWEPEDLERLLPLLLKADCLMLQFEIPLDYVWSLLDSAQTLGKLVILNMGPPRQTPIPLLGENTYVVLNAQEAQFYTSIPIIDLDTAKRVATVLRKKANHVIITLGQHGALVATGRETHHVPTPDVETIDPTGAGDTFCAALAVSLLRGNCLLAAARFACKKAALATTALGAQSASP